MSDAGLCDDTVELFWQSIIDLDCFVKTSLVVERREAMWRDWAVKWRCCHRAKAVV
jgi:hypothetical protein